VNSTNVLKRISTQIIDKKPIANPGKLFLISGFVFGMLMLIITPPFQGPDENVHFYRAAQIAKFDLTIDKDKDSGAIGGDLDTSFWALTRALFDKPLLPFRPDNKISPDTILDANSIDYTNKDGFYDFGGTASNPPLVYLPSAAGITIGKTLHLSPLASFYLARLGGLLSWIAITYFAIKKIPSHKIALMIVNFLPMLVFQVSVVTADTLSFALLSLFVANIVYYRSQKEDLTAKDWIKLIVLVILLSLSKRLFFVFVPLLLLIQPAANKFRNRVVQLGIIAASVPISLAWGFAMEAQFGSKILVGGGADPEGQISFLKSDPLALKGIFEGTYLSSSSVNLFKSFIGVFGWVDTSMSIFVILFSALVTFLALSRGSVAETKEIEPTKTSLSNIEKLLWLALAGTYFAAVNLAIYIYYSPVKTPFVFGLQGRYFIPILIVTLLMFLKARKHDSEKMITQKQLYIASQIVLTISVIVIAFRYYPIV